MQYHLNGFVPGNLQLSETARDQLPIVDSGEILSEVDILVVGCGPAGLTLARQLAEFPKIKTCIIDHKSGPMLFGQADGVSCRTIEIMEAYNSSELILKESYWLNQISFWDPDKKTNQNIIRSQKTADPRVGLSEFPHVVLNQARIHDLLLDGMLNSDSQLKPTYSSRLKNLSIDENISNKRDAFPIEAVIEQVDGNNKGKVKNVKAKYIVGCDGARSRVRESLKIPLQGDSSNKTWGVMDALVVTNFPDIRVKSFIKSANDGSMLIIPREGGYLVRLYIELEQLGLNERVSSLNIELDELIAAAKRILHPYNLTVKEVPWWSVYEIGQRVSKSFDNLPINRKEGAHARAFIAGDACHTHSPKAGQGMNVSIHDTFNLGWKLASVLLNRCHPKILQTYSQERRSVAQDLIALDKDFTKIVAGKSFEKNEISSSTKDTNNIKQYFTKQTGFIAGTAIQYGPSLIIGETEFQNLAEGFVIGQRFHSAEACRLADGKIQHIGHLNKADGRWRIFIFGGQGHPKKSSNDTYKLVEFLSKSRESPIIKYTPDDEDIDAVIDVYAVFQHTEDLSIEHLQDFLWPAKGKYGLRDYEKVFNAIPSNDIFDLRKINRDSGCIVIVRPDQHVANVLPLKDHQNITLFFDQFMIAKNLK